MSSEALVRRVISQKGLVTEMRNRLREQQI
jgi:hypothetical protein